MCKLIVHADDFGLTEKVNAGILKAHLHGILTSTSIIANGTAFEDAIGICRAVSSLDVGVHLTLVEERPVLKGNAVQTLINAGGRFHHHATLFTKRYLSGRISLREVERELEAQIIKVISRGISVSHIDSHQHLHMLPKILRITVQLAQKYGIPGIRVPYEMTSSNMLGQTSSISRVLQSLLLNFLCRVGRYTDVSRTDRFVGFLFSGNLNKENLQNALHHLPPTGTCELMCHPGLDDPDTPYSHWGYQWSQELNALTNPDISKFIQQKGIHLISYRQLSDLLGGNK